MKRKTLGIIALTVSMMASIFAGGAASAKNQTSEEAIETTAAADTIAPKKASKKKKKKETEAATEETTEKAETATEAETEDPEKIDRNHPEGRISVAYNLDYDPYEELAMTASEVETGINIRDTASEEGEILGYMYEGCAAWVLDVGDEWTNIYSGGMTGYVKTDYLVFGEDAKALAETYGSEGVTAYWDGVAVFAEPDGESEVVKVMNTGDDYLLVEETEHWYTVRTDKDSKELYYVSVDDVVRGRILDAAVPKSGVYEDVSVEETEETVEEETEESYEEEAQEEEYAEETQAPETSAPETQAAETSAPETQAAETSAPETQAAETSAPETEAVETSASDDDDNYVEINDDDSDDDDSDDDDSGDSGSTDEPSTTVVDDSGDDSSDDEIDEGWYDADTNTYYDADGNVITSSSTDSATAVKESTEEETEEIDGEEAITEEASVTDASLCTVEINPREYYSEKIYAAEASTEQYYAGTIEAGEGNTKESDTEIGDVENRNTNIEEKPDPSFTGDIKTSSDAPASVDADEATLLSALIYCEAGNQTYEGMVAVGAVVMNRINSTTYPNSMYEVIYQSGQFTPAMTGWLSSVLYSGGVPEVCYHAACDAISGENPVPGCLYFNTGSGSGTKIGAHQFY